MSAKLQRQWNRHLPYT